MIWRSIFRLTIAGCLTFGGSLLMPLTFAAEYPARDTLDTQAVPGDVGQTLAGLRWQPGEFTVDVQPVSDEKHQAVLRFHSPLDTGDEINDRVAMLWYRPPQVPATAGRRPAIIVVHESGSAMPVGRLFASTFAAKGIDSFMIQLPGYGLRKREGAKVDGERFLITMRQGIADVRRARDAVAALPEIDPERISLQGTSLGGFVSATVAGLDQGYDATYIMLAGGDLAGLLQRGEKEAAELRQRLERAGYTGERLQNLLQVIEPTRLASRIAADRMWLYSADQDRVVPLENAFALKTAAGLPDDHHIRLWGDHTSTIVFFPVIVQHVLEHLPAGNPPAGQ